MGLGKISVFRMEFALSIGRRKPGNVTRIWPPKARFHTFDPPGF